MKNPKAFNVLPALVDAPLDDVSVSYLRTALYVVDPPAVAYVVFDGGRAIRFRLEWTGSVRRWARVTMETFAPEDGAFVLERTVENQWSFVALEVELFVNREPNHATCAAIVPVASGL